MATRTGNGRWQVAMDAEIESDALEELVRDLVSSLPIDVAGGW